MKTPVLLVALLVGGAFALGACSDDGSSADASEVIFDVELIEIKGATDGISAPDVDPTSLSAGYRFTPPGDHDPDNPAKWQVSTYMFAPGAMTVVKGDEVTLRMFGVNGDSHDVWVVAPDGSTATDVVNVERGREVSLSFDTTQTGHYKLFCGIHGPTMQADILSLS